MILQQLADTARSRVAEDQKKITVQQMRTMAEQLAAETKEPFRFHRALKKPGLSFICEVKKASPSKGLIAEDFPYLSIAREYEEAGAAAISVLTEPSRFLGKDAYLQEIAAQAGIPVLRKDFTVDAYQIYQAKVLGAEAVLLIAALLDTEQLREGLDICRSLKINAIVEAHDAAEIASSLAAGADIVGVNNRNLKDFTVDIHNGLRLRSLVPEHVLFLAESGIRSAVDIGELKEAHVDAVLIGETLMRQADKKKALRRLQGIEETE